MTLKGTQGESELTDRSLLSLVPEGYKTGQVAEMNSLLTGPKEGEHLNLLNQLKAAFGGVDVELNNGLGGMYLGMPLGN